MSRACVAERLDDDGLSPLNIHVPAAFPSVRGERVKLTGIPGRPPDLSRPQAGCWFAPRCPDARDACAEIESGLYPMQDVQVRCLRYSGRPEWEAGVG